MQTVVDEVVLSLERVVCRVRWASRYMEDDISSAPSMKKKPSLSFSEVLSSIPVKNIPVPFPC